MGFNIKTTELLLYSRQFEIDFSKILTIGRQRHHGYHGLFEKLFAKYQLPKALFNQVFHHDNRYAERFLGYLGAKQIEAMDVSDYEKATIIHDMNQPIPDAYKSSFSLVIDSGSLEHVFNFPQAIKNCMEMVIEGGHFITITPANNFLGHGFYQFSPELFYRVFSEDNGFSVKKMFLFFPEEKSPMYEVSDPKQVKDRVKFRNTKETFLFVIAQKHQTKEIFKITPQQSDYEFIFWEDKQLQEKKKESKSKLKKIIPSSLIEYILKARRTKNHIKNLLSPLGDANPKYFKKINL